MFLLPGFGPPSMEHPDPSLWPFIPFVNWRRTFWDTEWASVGDSSQENTFHAWPWAASKCWRRVAVWSHLFGSQRPHTLSLAASLFARRSYFLNASLEPCPALLLYEASKTSHHVSGATYLWPREGPASKFLKTLLDYQVIFFLMSFPFFSPIPFPFSPHVISKEYSYGFRKAARTS